MIDVHCHILPGLDVGPSTLADSIAMAKQAAREGVKKIVATPLHRYRAIYNSPEAIIAAVDYINVREEKVPVKILPGQKIIVNSDIVEDLKRGELLPINETTQYITVELPQDQLILQNLEQIIFEIQMAGYIPVVSSPELHEVIDNNPNILYSAVKNGALCSIAAGSITGANGKRTQRLAERLLQADLIHFFGSNAKSSSKQGYPIVEAVEFLNKNYPGLSYQFLHNSESLIHGDTIPKNEPSRIGSKKWSIFGK